ncbi:M67 family metallopeptidase [Sphingobium nicotianae]|uniref:M67 family metallopeptidase n=1 Tax=Sphingobium nicotianae TaxID=2782607 RepID=A0A9X1DF93_9SPHN|nr:M67 family metallopeptidase [Sphingobium nicotianae]MBT2188900.1 M67 family metallopeptidase [Sphingobium nicotianae]
MSLLISTVQLRAIHAHADAESARECCGLLLGDRMTGMVRAVRSAANVAAHPAHRFEIDPAVLIAAHRAARTGGPAIIGHYHSHPTGDSLPSATDAAMAERGGEIWLIVGGDGAIRAWRAGPSGALHGCFDAVDVTIVPHPDLAPSRPQGH